MAGEIQAAFNAVYADGPTSEPDQPEKSRVRQEVGGTIQSEVDKANGAADSSISFTQQTAQDLREEMNALSDTIEGAAEGYVTAETWAVLSSISGTRLGQPGRVPNTDTGTHTDPVTSVAGVPNGGEYRWSTSPAGWKRIGDLLDQAAFEAGIAATFRTGPDIEGDWDEIIFDVDGKVVSGHKRGGGNALDLRAGSVAVAPPSSIYLFEGASGLQARSDDVIYMFIVMGQSLAQGYNALGSDITVTTSPEHPGAALMFDVGTRPGGRNVSSFTDLFEQDYLGAKETICSGMADVIMTGLDAALGSKPQMLWSIAAEGGILYASQSLSTLGLKRGADQYKEAVRLIRRAAEIATAQGKTLIVPALLLVHGETDTGVGTARWAYRRALSQLRFDLEAEIRSITGQREPLRGYAYQPCRGSGTAGVPSQVAESMLDGQDFDPAWRCVGPNYFAPDATGGGTPGEEGVDNAHCTARGYRRIGRMFGYAVLRDLFGPWFTPMRVIDHWWVSSTVFALKYPYPVAIESDDSRITISTLGAGKGVDFVDGSVTPPAITGIAVSGSDNAAVEVTLASAPAGMRKRAFIASRYTVNCQGPVYGVRSGIRSSAAYDTDPTDSAQLFHWACTEHVDL